MMEFQIGSRWVGDFHPVFIVAEIGCNHQGDPIIARRLVSIAAEAGVDAVKFQKRTIERVLTQSQLDTPYLGTNSFGRTYGEHRKALELSESAYCMLKEFADAKGVAFMASAWDEEAADFLETLEVPAIKVASADLTNLPLLECLACKNRPLLVSTGMSTLDEVDRAVEVIRRHTSSFALLQCTSAYPTAASELNLRVIPMFRKRFDCLVGYSSHESSTVISAAAIALGACLIEHHVTLNRAMKGSDHAASLEPNELRELVRNTRLVEEALGKPEKRIWSSEISNRQKLTKSVVSACAIRCGTVISRHMLTVMSPGTGISPPQIDSIVNRIAARDIPAETVLCMEDLVPLSPRH